MMRSKKRMFALLVSIILVSLFTVPAYSDTQPKYPIDVYLDGKLVDFGGVKAQILHDYAYVPIANVIELLTGKWPDWDDTTKTASFDFNGRSFKIVTKDRGIYVNNVFKSFDTPPENVNNRILIPLKMLSTALGFEQVWNNQSRVVRLTSPSTFGVTTPPTSSTSLASVVAAVPDKTDISAGEKVEVKIRTTKNATNAKIVDANNNIVAETKSFQTAYDSNVFTLSFYANTGGRYRVYAATSLGYNVNSYKDFTLTMKAVTVLNTINSVTLSSSTVNYEDYVTLTVYASSDTKSVRLVSDTYSKDIVTATSSTAKGNERVFELRWYVKQSYYPNVTSVSAKIYADNDNNYAGNYRTITVNINKSWPEIYSVTAAPSTMAVNDTYKMNVVTSTTVNRLVIRDNSSNAADETITKYYDSGNRRYWEFDKTAYSAGTRTIYVDAYNSANDSAQKSVSITVTGADPSIKSVKLEKLDAIYDGDTIIYAIETGLGVERLEIKTSQDLTNTTSSYTTTGNVRYWTLSVKTKAGAGGGAVSILINAFDKNGSITDTSIQSVTVKPLA